MSDSNNPYQAPVSPGEIPREEGVSDTGVTAMTRVNVGKAGPWLKFIAIIGFISCGLLAVMGVVFMVGGRSFLGQTSASYVGPLAGLLYIGLAVLFIFPSLFLLRMGIRAKRYKLGGEAADLESFTLILKQAAKFWGILTIVILGIYLIAVVAAILIPVLTASRAV